MFVVFLAVADEALPALPTVQAGGRQVS